MPFPTPFHPKVASRVESHEWRNWAGYLAPTVYEPSHEREYFAIRNAAALIDVSPLFKYEIKGPQSLQAVNRIMTRDFDRCAVGQVFYTPWCDDDGKVVDDGTVHRLAADHFRITSAEPNLAWFEDCSFGLEASVKDVTQDLASLALQGPNARAVLRQVVRGADWGQLAYYRFAQGEFDGGGRDPLPVTVSRTGYTGDLGYELWVAADHADPLWNRLFEAGEAYGLLPAGIAALDLVRIEAGLLMLQVDYISSRHAVIDEQRSSPYELGLGWAVDLRKPAFIGRKALLAESQRPPTWVFSGVEVIWDSIVNLYAQAGITPQLTGRASRQTVPIFKDNRQVGYATSHAFSPLLKQYIGLATLEAAAARPGTSLEFEITVEHAHARAQARPAQLPFFNPPRKRALEAPL